MGEKATFTTALERHRLDERDVDTEFAAEFVWQISHRAIANYEEKLWRRPEQIKFNTDRKLCIALCRYRE